MKRDNSVILYKEAVKYMPAGVNSPVRAFRSVGGTPVFAKKGKGSHLFDVDGNGFIDYCMSWGPLIFGHSDETTVDAVRRAAGDGLSFGMPHRGEIELAMLVCAAFPSMKKVRFVSSGTEATMSAVRLARGFTGRSKIVKFDGCYHGHADFLLVAGGSGLATFGTPDSAGVTADNAKDTLVLPFNDPQKLEKLLEAEGANVAAIIVEPVPCNYGLILPAVGYLKKIRELCDRYGILLIFDEVITGFRLAKGGAQEFFAIRADLTTLGKIIGGGMPVGAYGGREDVMAMIAPEGPVYQAGTLSGNPVAMAAGIATLNRLIDGAPYLTLKSSSEKFALLIKPSIDRFKGKVLFYRLESIFAFYFTDQPEIKSVDDVKKCDMKLFAAFHAEMLSRGIYLSPSGYEVGFFSTAHSEVDIEKTAKAVNEALEKVLG